MINIEELERLAKAATNGPWRQGGTLVENKADLVRIFNESVDAHHGDVGPYFMEVYDKNDLRISFIAGPTAVLNAEFITAANPSAVLELIGRIRELESKLAAVIEPLSDEEMRSVIREGAKGVMYRDGTTSERICKAMHSAIRARVEL